MSNDALETVKAGLDWLFHTEQDDPESIVSHHGIGAPVVGERRYWFVPSSFQPVANAVAVVDVAEPRYDDSLTSPTLLNPLETGELAALQAQIEAWGYQVRTCWNGDGCSTGSIGLAAPAHPSLLAALERNRKGCPDHPGEILCSWDGCPWYSTHTAKLKVPEGW